MAGQLTNTDHVGFTVEDLDRSTAYWSRLLEREPKARKTWDVPYLSRIHGYPGVKVEAAFFDLPGGMTLELIQYHAPSSVRVSMETYMVGNAHVSFATDDLQGLFDRMEGHGGFRSPTPVLIEWGPYEGGYAGRLLDPDGITVEVVQLPPGGVKL
ncbi:MAG: VOC family protein [Gaiellales bacterium]